MDRQEHLGAFLLPEVQSVDLREHLSDADGATVEIKEDESGGGGDEEGAEGDAGDGAGAGADPAFFV